MSDRLGRRYRYLRVSVTDRCDFACEYCMPAGGEVEHDRRAELLSFEEIVATIGTFRSLGVQRVRFTGGEPFVRKDFVKLVAKVAAAFPEIELALTTNASRLLPALPALRDAGLRSVNISIDSLDEARFAAITRGGDLGAVRAAIEAACSMGFEVKLNVVPMRNVNEDDWRPLVDFAWRVGATPRFIELMPLGEGARIADRRVRAAEVRAALAIAGEGVSGGAARGPARYGRGSGGRVGFIAPLSQGFCDGCNRIRINARGDLRACLADRAAVSLRDVLRHGGDARDLAWAALWALGQKADGHGFNVPGEREHEHVGMSLIGG
ncbi:MAG: GTP 3',8-cyclase MoaA [Myxococcota bacterium]